MMKLSSNDLRKIVTICFLAVPVLSSLISTIHIITFFGLGNMSWMAIVLALAFEIGSIASLMTLTVLDKINKMVVWFIFFVLVIMQMLGNVYYTYDFISQAMVSHPQWIDSFIDLVEMMTMQKLEQRTTKFILSLLIGLPIPIISLAFLKSVSDYLKPDTNVQEKIDTINTSEELSKNSIIEQENVQLDEELSDNEITVTESLSIQENDEVKEILTQEINSQITDSVTQSKYVVESSDNEISSNDSEFLINENKEISEEMSESEDISHISDETEIHENNEEINIETEEKKEDIYEEIEDEPEESFFDDSTVEEEYDDFKEDDDEKKSQL